MMEYLTAGESHGEYLTGILEGFPAGVRIPMEFVMEQLRRRRIATGRSARQQKETDDVIITGGWQDGITTGAPVGILIHNASRSVPKPSSFARPCHADIGGMKKYGISDASLIRERASARETAARTALFAFPLFLGGELGIRISSEVYCLGGKHIKCSENEEIGKIINEAKKSGDTIGGRFRINIDGVPVGLGSYSQGKKRLFSIIAAELSAIPAIKSVSCGEDSLPDIYGSEMIKVPEITGGIDGGISNGRKIIISCSVKPVPGTAKPYMSENPLTGETRELSSLTSDITATFATAVIAEGAVAYSVLQTILEKFGGNSFEELKQRISIVS